MTRAEKFEQIFGLKVDTTMDCGYFDCTDQQCSECIFNAPDPKKRQNLVKAWWSSEYGG